MAIRPVSSEQLHDAFADFDQSQRNTEKWDGWEKNKTHRYAISHEGQFYPVKEIVSLATGTPVSDFSGGVGTGQTNQYVEDRGFEVVELRRRNPPWYRDELILALDLYLKNQQSLPGPESDEIKELSRTLNELGSHLDAAKQEDFRNPNGVGMKLMNFRALDPNFPSGSGLPHGSKLDKKIWTDFASDPEKCHRAAESIRNAIAQLNTEMSADESESDDDEYEAEEGRAVTRVHRRRERNRKIVGRKKQSVLKKTGKLECEGCGFDFHVVYGERGEGFIECHHVKPVHELDVGSKTRLADLCVLCANCHRMIHAKRPWLTVEELRGILELATLTPAS